MRVPRLLVIVNENTSLSGPLELALHLADLPLDLHIAVYYEDSRSDYYAKGHSPADLPTGVAVHWLCAGSPSDLRAAWRTALLISELQPDIVHVHHTISSAVASILSKLLRVPVVVRTEHNDHRRFKYHQNVLNAISLACADRVICNSNATNDSMHRWEQWLAGAKTLTIYNGVDVERIRTRAAVGAMTIRGDLGIPTDAPVVGSIGRLIEQKDYGTLLEAFAAIARERDDAYCMLVGGGRLEQDLRKLGAKLGIDSRLILTGNVPRDRAYEFLGLFDVFVVPSVWEGFCNAAVEAMAAGVPLICSDIGTLREVVGTSGSYFEQGSAEALAEVLRGVLAKTATQRKAAGQQAAAWVHERYRIQETASRYFELYEEVLSTQRSLPRPPRLRSARK